MSDAVLVIFGNRTAVEVAEAARAAIAVVDDDAVDVADADAVGLKVKYCFFEF